MVATQRQFLQDQIEEQRAKVAALDLQRAQKQAERDTVAATVDKLESTLPVLAERLAIRKTLYDHETGSKANYLEMLQSFIEEKKEIDVQKSHLKESEAALAAIEQTRGQTIAEFRRSRFSELVEAERKGQGFAGDFIKAQEKTKLQQLTAPVDGTVQQLAVHTDRRRGHSRAGSSCRGATRARPSGGSGGPQSRDWFFAGGAGRGD